MSPWETDHHRRLGRRTIIEYPQMIRRSTSLATRRRLRHGDAQPFGYIDETGRQKPGICTDDRHGGSAIGAAEADLARLARYRAVWRATRRWLARGSRPGTPRRFSARLSQRDLVSRAEAGLCQRKRYQRPSATACEVLRSALKQLMVTFHAPAIGMSAEWKPVGERTSCANF